jgi:hypothetical protein
MRPGDAHPAGVRKDVKTTATNPNLRLEIQRKTRDRAFVSASVNNPISKAGGLYTQELSFGKRKIHT